MKTTRMRLGALLAAGAVTLTLGACGGDDDGVSDSTPTTTQDGEDTEDGGATQDGEQSTAGGAAPEAGSAQTGAAGDGEEVEVQEFLDLLTEPDEDVRSRYTVTMDVDADGQTAAINGAIDLSGDKPKMQMTMSMPDMGTVDLIFIDGSAYMSMPGVTQEGTYLEAPEELLGDNAEFDQLDVNYWEDAWGEGAQQVLFLGEEEVDGQQLRHYRVTQDLQAATESMQDDADATADPLAGADTIIDYDIWLDEDNLMRLMSFQGEDGSAPVEIHFDNWGDEVDIKAPDPDQIMDMNDLGGGPTG